MKEKLRIDCISDLHGYFPNLTGGDLLIVAGDLTAKHTEKEHFRFNEWLEEQNYKKIILIAGNHDTWIEEYDCCGITDYDGQIVEYLCDSGTEFEGLKIWGSPWSLTFAGINPYCTAFTGTEEELKAKFDLIPDDIDILITHGPPFGILDGISMLDCNDGTDFHTGSHELLKVLERTKPRLLVCAHIHENGGKQIIYKRPGYGDENNTVCVNASIVNEKYRHVNKPVRIEL